MNKFTKATRPILPALTLLALTNYSAADDIDLYTSAVNNGGGNADAAGHNILFVMDTSGSMGSRVAALSPRGNYDKDRVYGNEDDSGVSPEKIYVYDENMIFTDNTIELDQNKCAGLAARLTADYPVYYDRGLQWQQNTNTIPGGTTNCRDEAGAPQVLTYSSNNVNAKNKWKRIKEYTVAPGVPFSITISTDEDIIFEVDTDYYNQGNGYTSYCRINIDAGESGTCTGTTESFDDSFDVWVYGRGDKPSVSFAGSVGTVTEVCDTETGTQVTVSDWDKDFVTPNETYNVFDCQGDSGTHGVNSISGLTYLKNCDTDPICTAPSYSSSSGDEVNWASVSRQNYVSANYHDYLTSTGYIDDSADLPSGNPDNYCDSNSKLGTRFFETNTKNVYECYTRLGLMQLAVNNLVSTLTESPINIGLMRFNNGADGGTVVSALSAIKTNTDFTSKLNAFTAGGGTPLSESLYEAYLYLKGETVDHGKDCIGDTCTDAAAKVGTTYTSPITASCQTNNIVFLSDGEPSGDGDSDSDILALSPKTSCGTTGGTGKCLDEIAEVMATQDMSGVADGINTVNTYTIGLDSDIAILRKAAEAGNGAYYSATGSTALEAAFRNIVVEILNDSASFAAPAVTVNAFNELQHRNEVYYSVFQPDGTPRWNGNVKKYKFSDDGNLVGQDGTSSVIGDFGFFSDSAHSFWSESPDGKEVSAGGAGSRLSNSRNIYTTYVTASESIPVKLAEDNFDTVTLASLQAGEVERTNNLRWLLGLDVFNDNKEGGNESLTDANKFMADSIHTKPTVVTYGGTTDTPEEVLFFATNLGTLHAVDPNDAQGTELWAHLPEAHRPNLQSYIKASNTDQHVYGLDGEMTVVTTPTTGNDSTILLDSANLYIGERRGGSRYYGFDVSNARINANDEQIQLDTSHTQPFKKRFTITGALHGKPATTRNPGLASPGFSDLGQTWSAMVPATIKYNNTSSKDVLIFSGGYDPRHDVASYRSQDSGTLSNAVSDYGNAIYIVDAQTGALLASIGNNEDDNNADILDANTRNGRTHDLNLPMQDAIPASPTVIDVDGDGAADMIFAVDIMGHVWRIDLDKTQPAASVLSGGMIADLSSADNRRFYNSLDVSRSNVTSSGSNHLNIVVGSGYRSEPIATEPFNNNIYILFDNYPTAREAGADRYNYFSTTEDDVTTYRTVVASDLVETSSASPQSKASAPYGFYRQLESGEKALQRSLTFNNTIIIPTFVPGGGTNSACGGGLGGNRVYVLDANTGVSVLTQRDEITGEPILHDGTTDGSGNAIDADGNIVYVNQNGYLIQEYYELQSQGIAAGTSVLVLKDLVVCFSTECNIDIIEEAMLGDLELGRAYRSSWREK
jgi:type IV pilus assembly protein PilY1